MTTNGDGRTVTIRFGLKKKVIALLVVLLVVPLSLLGALTSNRMRTLGAQSVDDGAAALRAEAETNLETIVGKKALLIEERFEQYEAEIEGLATIAESIWSEPDRYRARRSYYHNPSAISEMVPGLQHADRYGEIDISLAVSMFKIAPEAFINETAYRAQPEPAFNFSLVRPSVATAVNTSVHLEYPFISTYDANDEYGWLYMGTAEGVMRMYPWNTMETNYDPRARGWYTPWSEDPDGDGYPSFIEAEEGSDPNNAASRPDTAPNECARVFWTDPYIDAAGLGLMITGSMGVYNTTTGALIGVIGADVTILTLNQQILDISLGGESHAFLIDRAGNTIAHRDFSNWSTDIEWNDVVLGKSIADLESDSSEFLATVAAMGNATEPALAQVTYEDQNDYYIAYGPIGSADAIIGLVVPVDDIIAPTKAIDASITDRTDASVIAFIVVVAIVIAVVIVAGILVISRIVGPIRQLTEAANRVAAGDLDVELDIDTGDEIGLLAQRFANIMTILRIGNAAYFTGDTKKALNSYQSALLLFREAGNEHGEAMCYNNLGNIYHSLGDDERALEYYSHALKIDRKEENTAGIANRLNNIGNIYRAREEDETAERYYTDALNRYEKLDDEVGCAQVYNNLGILRQRTGDEQAAIEQFERALAIYRRIDDARGVSRCYNNIGLLLKQRGEFQGALKYLGESLQLSEELGDKRGIANNLANLHELYQAMGQPEKAAAFKARSEELRDTVLPSSAQKTVFFVVDRSGSMVGERMNAAKAGAVELLHSRVNPEDHVGVISFASRSTLDNELVPMSQGAGAIEKTIKKLQPYGSTAFFDAIGDAVKHFIASDIPGRLWVVALTDGEDNSSINFGIWEEYSRYPISQYIEETGIDAILIVIGVGDEIRRDLMELLVAPDGRYIHVADTGDVDIGIRAAYKEVGEMFEESESVEGFVPEY